MISKAICAEKQSCTNLGQLIAIFCLAIYQLPLNDFFVDGDHGESVHMRSQSGVLSRCLLCSKWKLNIHCFAICQRDCSASSFTLFRKYTAAFWMFTTVMARRNQNTWLAHLIVIHVSSMEIGCI